MPGTAVQGKSKMYLPPLFLRPLVTTERLYWKALRMVHGNRKILDGNAR